MDYDAYRTKYIVEPPPVPRYGYSGIFGVTLYFNQFYKASQYYSSVLGPPAYIEKEGTLGWLLGSTWLTLLSGGNGSPKNMEFTIVMNTVAAAEEFHADFIKAGGQGESPSNQFMYEPVRYCPVRDPFGTEILIICPLSSE